MGRLATVALCLACVRLIIVLSTPNPDPGARQADAIEAALFVAVMAYAARILTQRDRRANGG